MNYARMTAMESRATHIKTAAILAGFLLALVACNLGTSSGAPPTLAPLPTFTPRATLGYASVGPVSVIADIGVTPAPPSDAEMQRILAQVESDRLMSHIRSLQDFGTRHILSRQDSTATGIGAARRYINDQLDVFRAASGDNLYKFEHSFQAFFSEEERTTLHNIVGAISGTALNAGTIMVGAHYDSIGTPRSDSSVYAPGSNDNGSGVAAVLELARIMSRQQYKATVMFVLFSSEEFARQGSIAFANWIRENNIDLIGMFNLDSIGNVHDFSGRVNDRQLRVYSDGPNDSSVSRKLAREANLLGYLYDLDLELQVQDAIDRENRWGDHFSFSELNYPAIRIINANEEKLNGDPTDTIEFVESDYLRRATQATLAIVTALADGPRPPANIVLRQRENGTRELVWEPVADAVSYIIALRPPDSLVYQQVPYAETKLPWDGFTDFAGIAVAAVDERGIIGPLSHEIVPS